MRRLLNKYKLGFAALLVLGMGAGLFYFVVDRNRAESEQEPESSIPTAIVYDTTLEDNLGLYKEEDQFKVYEVYLTVYTGLDSKSGESFDLTRLNQIEGTTFDPELKVNVFVTDPDTGEVVAGEEGESLNATIELRGQSARNFDQKSYKINLSKQTRLFQGQQKLNLNKHISDDTRVTQKFAFDAMIGLPHFTSVRTNFMHVQIKDGTDPAAAYVDYGLFTHVENVDDEYLKVRSLNENATFLKPVDFAFTVAEAEQVHSNVDAELILRDINQPGDDKLLEMITAINEPGTAFDDIFDYYFDRENYLTWIALNILLNNYDTMSRNFLLYSPSNVDKWYFLPWDYDVSMISPSEWETSEYAKWFGLQRYWGVSLHRKFFQTPENVVALSEKIDSLYQAMMQDGIEEKAQNYREIYEKYVVASQADRTYLEEVKGEESSAILERISQMPATLSYNYATYYERLEAPMPFYLDSISEEADGIAMNWEDAVDLQNDVLSYEVSIFTNPDDPAASSIWSQTTTSNQVLAENVGLADGIYYWQAVAVDNNGNRQFSFDRCKLEPGYRKLVRFGMKKFSVQNGVIKEADDSETPLP